MGIPIGISSKNLFHHKEDRVSGLTHGDDFVLTGPTEKLMEVERKMTSVYPIKPKIISYGSSKSIKTLNRRLHWGERGIMYQHDPRHVDVLVKDLGLEHGNSVQTPAAPNAMEEEKSEPLSQDQHHRHRSHVARCLFLSQDRADITFIVNELCQKMSNPNQQSLARLKRLARYLKRERQWGHVFKYEKIVTRSDNIYRFGLGRMQENSKIIKRWRGDARRTRLEGVHAKTENHCKSSAEAELYAAALGASEVKGIASVLRDLGYGKRPVLAIDAKATEHILHRQGIGKLKHIDVAYLWIQDEVRSQRLQVRRVRSEDNRSGNKTTEQGGDREALSHNGVCKHESGRCSEGLSIVGRSWDLGSAGSR